MKRAANKRNKTQKKKHLGTLESGGQTFTEWNKKKNNWLRGFKVSLSHISTVGLSVNVHLAVTNGETQQKRMASPATSLNWRPFDSFLIHLHSTWIDKRHRRFQGVNTR